MSWDPVHDAREAFLVCFRAFCEPGKTITGAPRAWLHEDTTLDVAAAVLLALLDRGIGLCVVGDGVDGELGEKLRHKSAAVAMPPELASYILVTDRTTTSVTGSATRGTALKPEGGATIVYAGSWEQVKVSVERPAGYERREVLLGLPPGEIDALAVLNAEPPLGVDALVVNGQSVQGLPRSAIVSRGLG